MADGPQPGAAVHDRPVEVGLALLDLPGMDRDSHRQRCRQRPRLGGKDPLQLQGGGDRLRRAGEDAEGAVALPLALTSRPPWSATACDTRRSWRARAPAIAWRSASHRRVEPSTSVSSKVNVISPKVGPRNPPRQPLDNRTGHPTPAPQGRWSGRTGLGSGHAHAPKPTQAIGQAPDPPGQLHKVNERSSPTSAT
jgi:hypothetical protein